MSSSANLSNPAPLWLRLQAEAEDARDQEPMLGSLFSSVLHAPSFEYAIAARLASRLCGAFLTFEAMMSVLVGVMEADATIAAAAQDDIAAVIERDPACERVLEPFLFFKGYAAIQTHRIAHSLWSDGRRDFAVYLQGKSSEAFQTDIHPAAQFGRGIFLDHATGFVAGETVVIEDNVSILHDVTLGGTGLREGQRHPKIRTGVLIGAGAHIIGDIEIGAYSKIAAGSLVTQSVPSRCTAVGVPARIIEGAGTANPAQSMDQALAEGTYDSFTYTI